MAKHLALLLAAALLVGCQQKSRPHSTLPLPNLDAPVVEAQPAPAQAPVLTPSPLPLPAPEKPRPRVLNVPGEWIPEGQANHWQWIVIHHSASNIGCAATFDRGHRQKGWDELGYHFVIGNGSRTIDGQVEVGPRWPKQKWGAHAKTPDNQFNDFGIGVCLVGDFETRSPSPAQLQSLARLVAYLMEVYRIPADRVVGHRDCKPTDCPGQHLSIAQVRRQAAQVVQSGSLWVEAPTQTASRIIDQPHRRPQ